jgi:3-hydroxyisobutyrate dehydrogenase-like beta-hydroxyacid dehydrogenase
MQSVAFIGYGELAHALAGGLTGSGVELHAFVRPRGNGAATDLRRARMSSAGVRRCASIGEAVGAAEVVIATVPASSATEVVEACAPYLRPGQLYVDPSSSLPGVKRAGADRVGRAGSEYADVAVLGTVVTAAAKVAMLAAGDGARRWRDEASAAGLNVTAVEGPPGAAALVKLLRSVFMKGRDALVLEMILAARRHGVLDAVLDSIGGPGEQVPFPCLAERVMCSLAVYAERRADELADAASLLREVGVDPTMTEAGEARLRRLSESGLRARFGDDRPGGLSDVLACLDELAAADR